MPFRPAKIDEDVLALDVTKVAQSISKSLEPTFHARGRACTEKTDARHPRRLLRACHDRPRRRCAAERRHELAAPHALTSPARASAGPVTSRPSAFAVLRLITSSYLVGACTGRSAGFSPVRMRST